MSHRRFQGPIVEEQIVAPHILLDRLGHLTTAICTEGWKR